MHPLAGAEAEGFRAGCQPRGTHPVAAAPKSQKGRVKQQFMEQEMELIEKCLQGSDEAWRGMIQSYAGFVRGCCYRFTGRWDETADLSQEVFLRLHQNLHTFDPDRGSFGVWLQRLVRNLLIDYYRACQKHNVLTSLSDDLLSSLAEQPSSGDHPLHWLSRQASRQELEFALQELAAERRIIIILRDLEEMQFKEIAQVLKLHAGTVRTRYYRARRELSRQLRRKTRVNSQEPSRLAGRGAEIGWAIH